MAQNKSYRELMELMGAQTGTNGQKANAMLELIEGRKPFSYNPATDPAAQAVRKETARNIGRTTQDTLGSYAAMTGGMPSSAAVSAAAQAGNYAGAQGADRIAELEQLARQNYNQETSDMQNMWSIFQNQADAERNQQLEMAKLAAAYGDYSGLKKLGIDTSKHSNSGGPDSYKYTPELSDPDDEAHDQLLSRYNGYIIPADQWPSLAAQYGESKLIAWGFRKGEGSTSNGSGGKTGGDSIRAGKFRMDMME